MNQTIERRVKKNIVNNWNLIFLLDRSVIVLIIVE